MTHSAYDNQACIELKFGIFPDAAYFMNTHTRNLQNTALCIAQTNP